MGDVWGWVSAAAVTAAMGAAVFGLPLLLLRGRRGKGGGGQAERRAARGGYRIRVGPGLPALTVLALARRLDVVLPVAATVAVVVLAALNARA
ncbi:hypothetical protein ACFXJ8_39235 [Nonomuraea sp. NPDC059194]|uniref:hypothetical protein n=1 Tax=Nonomuraea sp. NPDC059194 TaxID=3346764 RepID=UPI0036C60101